MNLCVQVMEDNDQKKEKKKVMEVKFEVNMRQLVGVVEKRLRLGKIYRLY